MVVVYRLYFFYFLTLYDKNCDDDDDPDNNDDEDGNDDKDRNEKVTG